MDPIGASPSRCGKGPGLWGGAEAAEGSPAEAKYASSEEACKAAKKFAVSGDAQQVPRCPELEFY